MKEMENKNASLLLLTALDDVACKYSYVNYTSSDNKGFFFKGYSTCEALTFNTTPSSSRG